jgi:phage-related protein
MAIGRVGSFATVEPALVDFGSMAERNIDKIKAEEEAKKVAQAKKEQEDKDRLKDINIPEKLGFTNISEVDKSLQGTFKKKWEVATEAKMSGDERTLYEAVGTMNTLISYADQIKDTPGKIAERVEKDKTLDEDIIDIYLRDFNSLRENGYQVNTDDPRNMTISLINEKGELMNEQPLTEFIETRKVLPRKINLIDETKKVLSTIKPSVSESGSYALNTKITDINSKESKPQVEAIKENVNLWVSNNDGKYTFFNVFFIDRYLYI